MTCKGRPPRVAEDDQTYTRTGNQLDFDEIRRKARRLRKVFGLPAIREGGGKAVSREGDVRLGFCGFAESGRFSVFRDMPCGNIGP